MITIETATRYIIASGRIYNFLCPEAFLSPLEVREWCQENITPNANILIFTFSNIIINYLGEMISKKQLSSKNIQIRVLREDRVDICRFDEEGYIIGDWEVGFLT